ncbi:hypothetical protein GCM10010976_27370 [Bizionia arctica]|uniref:Uncharacterized protein n=1 Tax=Bizionia arctica TaxID=1495645 RepID=A0A917GR79_9FLAO|nr:hypothetical protein GCM10010976_27370 [Bizionia arctica]
MNNKVNKIYFARIHKTSLTEKIFVKKTMNLVVGNNTKSTGSIEKGIEYLEDLNNLILSHKIQLWHIRNNSIMKTIKDINI